MNPRDAVAEFKGKVPTGAGWRPKVWCPAAGNEFTGNVQPASKEPRELKSVFCIYCEIDHPLNVRPDL